MCHVAAGVLLCFANREDQPALPHRWHDSQRVFFRGTVDLMVCTLN